MTCGDSRKPEPGAAAFETPVISLAASGGVLLGTLAVSGSLLFSGEQGDLLKSGGWEIAEASGGP